MASVQAMGAAPATSVRWSQMKVMTMKLAATRWWWPAAWLLLGVGLARSDDAPRDEVRDLRQSAETAMRQAVEYFRQEVATEGGYLWRYTVDLSRREGEGRTGDTTVWVQTPGTPAVGQSFLAAYEATGDAFYLDAARDAGEALRRGQLRSGGWDYRIEFDPAVRAKYAYRVDPDQGQSMNVTTFDDNVTQGAVRFLIALDRATGHQDAELRDAIDVALDAMLRSQYPNGAWPQRYSELPESDRYPVRTASYPESWSREYRGGDYRGHYTFNDNLIRDMVGTLLLAGEEYDRADFREAVRRAGDFILSAQMPEPQPAWAQQYDLEMHPAWARRFEPPSITGGESQGVLSTLLVLYEATGEQRFLQPVPRAIEYLRSSLLPDGRLARFYELQTNRPLYFTREYELTYEDDDLPTHYAFKVSSRLDQIESQYRRCLAQADEKPVAESKPSPAKLPSEQLARIRRIVQSLDDEGRWVEAGRLRYYGDSDPARKIIDCRTFNSNLQALARFVQASRATD